MTIDSLVRFLDGLQQLPEDTDRIVAYDGETFCRRTQSEFQRKLEDELLDPQKGALIANSYRTHLAPHLTLLEKQAIEKWILENCRFIGSVRFDTFWQGRFVPSVQSIMDNHRERWQKFCKEVQYQGRPCSFMWTRRPDRPMNIAIITTSGGGGHYSVAEAIAQILVKSPQYRVTLVDGAPLETRHDPLFRVSGLLSGVQVYDQVFQQAGDEQLAQRLWKANGTLRLYVEDANMQTIKQQVRDINPDLVISTRHFWEKDLDIASSLNVPLRFAHCDFELSYALLKVMANANRNIVKLWLPANDAETIHPSSTRLKAELIDQFLISRGEAEVDLIHEACMSSMIQFSGYPVREAFQRVTDPAAIEAIRQKHHVPPKAQVITITMGKQGTHAILATVKALNESEVHYEQPLHIAVLCGKNDPLRYQLQGYLAERGKRHPQITFALQPLLDQKETAEWLTISEVVLMKPGGASTGEALQMGVKSLILLDKAHSWEKCNADHLVRHRLGQIVESTADIPAELKALLAAPASTREELIDPRVEIPRLVDEAIRDFASEQQRQIEAWAE